MNKNLVSHCYQSSGLIFLTVSDEDDLTNSLRSYSTLHQSKELCHQNSFILSGPITDVKKREKSNPALHLLRVYQKKIELNF